MTDAPANLHVSLAGENPILAGELLAAAESRGEPIPLGDLYDMLKASEAKARATLGLSRERDRSGMIPRSVQVGDVTLRSLSIAGSIALRKIVVMAPELDQLTYDILAAWVYAHSWDMGAMSRLVDLQSAEEIVQEWSAGLTCSGEELSAGIDALNALAFPEPEPGRPAGSDPATLLDAMLKRYGGFPLGMMRTPMATAAHLMDAANQSEIAAIVRQAKAHKQQPPADVDPKLAAERAYQAAKDKLAGKETQ